jgi:hypothetical protein
MATLSLPSRLSPVRPGDRFARLWRQNPPLALTGVVMLAVVLATLIGLVVDPRQVINEPIWLKPAKFAVSIAIYSFTLLWLMTFITKRRGLVLAVSWVVAIAFLVEEAIIGYQAMRGVRSHFNEATPFDSMLFRWMAIAIVLLWVANLVVAVLLLRQRFPTPVFAWGLRFGLLIALLGMAVAFLMPQPTPAQREQMRSGARVDIVGAHSVGVEDGGPGLPIVGWSTVGGDLRVPHFVGIHALQAMPVIAWLLTLAPVAWLSVGDRARLMVVAGIGGFGLVGLLTWQALRGQPLIAPDQLTLTALLGGIAVLGLAAMAIVLNARRRVGRMAA